MSKTFFTGCIALTIVFFWNPQRSAATIENVTSVEVVTGDGGAPPYDLQSVTVGSYSITTADLRPGTTEAEPGGNDGGNFFGTWLPPFDTAAPSSNFDINDILARNDNPNPIIFRQFGGIDLWFDTNGVNPDFFLFEAASSGFGDTDPSAQAILPGGVLGQAVDIGDSGNWGDTGLTRVGNPNGGQSITGVSFAITDLLDDTGTSLSNSSMIEGIQVNSSGLDPSTLAAVMIGIEPLSIEVNTTSGEIKIRNDNSTWPITEEFSFYRIESPSGALNPSGWTSIDGDNNLGDGWDPSGGSDENGISELNLTGSSTLAPGEFFSLGSAFAGGPLEADFDEDGDVDGDDFLQWQGGFGTPSGAEKIDGDYDNDGDVDGDDFLGWQSEFGSTAGGAPDLTFVYATPMGVDVEGIVNYVSTRSLQSVPEPTAVGLATCAGVLIGLGFCRRRFFHAAMILLMNGAFFASPVSAELVHKYNFNDGTATDSVGTAHGNIVDQTGISFFVAGQFSLTNNNGAPSGQDYTLPATVGTYVDLPNGIFTGAVNGGTNGQVTVETWLTVETNRGSARYADFGSQNDGDGEDEPTGGANMQSYVALQPQAGDTVLIQMRKGDPAVDYQVGAMPPLAEGIEYHVVAVLDDTDFDADFPDGRARLYVNGSEVAVGSLPPFPFLGGINDFNNWLGRSQFAGNPLFDGRIDEFRMYDNALDAGTVMTNFTIGPDPGPPAVELTVDRSTGEVFVANNSSGDVQITGYTITSAAGALDAALFTSINADGTFDPDGTWNATSSTSIEIAESESTGGNGGTVAATDSLAIGTPWRQTPFADLTFEYTVDGGGTEAGIVNYTGPAIILGDLTGDGNILIDDWAIFVANNYADLSSSSPAEAYQKGDLDGDLDNDKDDFFLFRNAFIAENGAAAFGALTGVPEPASLALAALAAAGLVLRRRRSA